MSGPEDVPLRPEPDCLYGVGGSTLPRVLHQTTMQYAVWLADALPGGQLFVCRREFSSGVLWRGQRAGDWEVVPTYQPSYQRRYQSAQDAPMTPREARMRAAVAAVIADLLDLAAGGPINDPAALLGPLAGRLDQAQHVDGQPPPSPARADQDRR